MKAFLFALVLCSCSPYKPLPVHPQAEDTCEAFCEALEMMLCDGASGSPGADEVLGTLDDPGCPRTCVEMSRTYSDYPMDRACLNGVTSCGVAENCLFGE